MKLRHLLTASIFGIALAAGAPAKATSGNRIAAPPAPAAGLSDTVHEADWRGGHRGYRGERRAKRRAHRRAYRRGHRHWDRRDYRRDRRYHRRAERRHYRQDRRAYRRGGYLPHRRYRVVPNWYDYGWRRPYRGERYVYLDGRYFLIQAATGLIITALLY